MTGRRRAGSIGWGTATVIGICLGAPVAAGISRSMAPSSSAAIAAAALTIGDVASAGTARADADADITATNAAALAGGGTTVFDEGPNAFGRALANLDAWRWTELRDGKERFLREWPQRGPWADASSCSDCHFRDGRGPRPDAASSGLSHLLRLGRSSGGVDPVYGAQLRRLGLGVPAPGVMTIVWEESSGRYPSGEAYTLRQPMVRVTALAFGPLDPETRFSLRVPPVVFGLGLIEAVSERDISDWADADDLDGDGISGRVQQVRDPAASGIVPGRFGWKAAQPSLAAQSATALLQDLGVTSPLASASIGPRLHRDDDVAALVRYLRALAVPARRRWREPGIAHGGALFAQAGCVDCHRPRLTTGQVPGWPELSGQRIQPYTDLLLHDMGPGLADGVAEGVATGREWRTPPLWGLGLLPVVSGEVGLLHDGRARSVEEAILWHAGEATRARERFMALSRSARDALIAFVGTL